MTENFEISEILEMIDDLPSMLICDLCHQRVKKLNKMKHYKDLEICDNCLDDFRSCECD